MSSTKNKHDIESAARVNSTSIPETSEAKQRITIMLDAHIISYFKTLAGPRGGYQTLINETLKKVIDQDGLEFQLRQIIREELVRATPLASPKQEENIMPNIAIFCSDFCKGKEIFQELLQQTSLNHLDDATLIQRATQISALDETQFARLLSGKSSIFNSFTHERERSLAYLKTVVAEALEEGSSLITGFSSLLVPRSISHIFKVGLIADNAHRVENAAKQFSSKEAAVKAVAAKDAIYSQWAQSICNTRDPWDSSLYDLLIPMDKTSVADAAALIIGYIQKNFDPTSESRQAVADFKLASKAAVALARKGHSMEVTAHKGVVELILHKQVLLRAKFDNDLRSILDRENIAELEEIVIREGEDYQSGTHVYRQYDFSLPSKVLLVDDEREFVQTLSERLTLREMGSAVAHDGESALRIIDDEEPEVIVLDLNMPGIDGIEVLRRIKQDRPEIEVIILTGHGSEEDRRECMELGAFDYIHKPYDIELLTERLNAANAKFHQTGSSAAA
ncbi:MAG: response regulator [Thermodesulfobacteriota bacterium]